MRVTGQLRRRWFAAAAGYVLALATVGGLLLSETTDQSWPLMMAARWAAGAALVLGGELWLFWRKLPLHRRSDQPLPGLGPGNTLTLVRGAAIGLAAGFLLTPWPPLAWLPALLYTLAGLADYFDGYLARASGTATAMGEALDIEFDALGVLAASALAVHFGQWPIPFLVIGAARYLFILGLWLRRRRGLPIYDLPPSPIRRTLAGLQMGFLSVALWPIMPPMLATVSGLCFGFPFLVVFGRDWLITSGAIRPAGAHYQTVGRVGIALLVDWGPLAGRLLAALAAALLLAESWRGFDAQVALYAGFGFANPTLAASTFAFMLAVAIPALLCGAAVRFFALWLLVSVGFGIAAAGFQPASLVALVAAIYLLIVGPGRYALWRPDERIAQRRAGE